MNYFTDETARILASGVPRRRALALLARVVLGGIAGSLALKQAQAQDKDDKKDKDKGTQCGDRRCGEGQVCCNDTVCCGHGQGCRTRRCSASRE